MKQLRVTLGEDDTRTLPEALGPPHGAQTSLAVFLPLGILFSQVQKWHHSPRRLRTPRIPDSGLKLSTQHPKSKQIIPLATLSSAGAKSVTSSQTT